MSAISTSMVTKVLSLCREVNIILLNGQYNHNDARFFSHHNQTANFIRDLGNGFLVSFTSHEKTRPYSIHGSLCRGRLGRGSNELGRDSNELGRGSSDQNCCLSFLKY